MISQNELRFNKPAENFEKNPAAAWRGLGFINSSLVPGIRPIISYARLTSGRDREK